MSSITKRIGLMAAAFVASMPAYLPSADAQTWPNKTVKFVVPLGPSSGADITARLVADRLQAKWGQPVVVENRAGGDGLVGIQAFLTANDDHTLFFGPTAAYTAHPYMRTSVPYNAADIIPIVRTTVTVVAIAVPTSLGVNSLKDLVDRAKKEPGKMNWSAVTGLNDFQFGAFVKVTGMDMVKVPYRDLNQAVNDLGEGRIQVYSAAYVTIRPAIESGKVKALAINNTVRAPMLPDIPTAREAGFPTLEFDGLVGIHGVAAVTQATRTKIMNDTIEALKDPTIAQRLTTGGTVVMPGTTEEFAKAIENQKVVAAQTAKVLGITAAK